MRKIICGLIIGLLLSTTVYAFRTAKPPRFTKLDDPVQLTQLNNTLEDLWNITNGRISFDVETSVPSGSGSEGDLKVSNVDSVYKIHMYINGEWRSWASD